jgi:hypothetical protein
MTGRGAGYCAGSLRAGWQHPIPGRLGRAFRRGWGFHGSPRGFSRGRKLRGAPCTEQEALQAHRDVLRSELETIEQELAAVEAKKADK